MFRCRVPLFLLLGALVTVPATRAEAPVNREALERIDGAVQAALARNELPGAVVLVTHRGETIYRKAFGLRGKQPAEVPMTVDTVFDLASLTKPVATATSMMILLEQGKYRLGDRVAQHLPAFGSNGKDRITVEQLLLHTSGLIADNPLADYQDGRARALERVHALKPVAEPGSRFIYSDVNFIVLGELVERFSGLPLDQFAQKNIFDPLGMKDTRFLPDDRLRQRAAPTEQRDGRWIVGEVHDPRSYKLGGVAGHAGLFGTADDLAVYAQMLLRQGNHQGKQLLAPATVRAMTEPRPVPNGERGLGWDVRTGFSSNRGELFPRGASFGHTGFTGTSLWIDPASQTAVVFLSNRVHPDGKGNVTRLRGQVATLAAAAVGYAPTPTFATGIDVLAREKFKRLQGRRVGLVTNHTGQDRAGRSTIDLLHQAEGVKLVALFSPEHGIRGAVDAKVSDSKDAQTGLPIYSLYGERRKPTPDTLRGIDTLVFDIQDAGCRFYTYISTMGLVLEAAAENKIRVVVLDRPNPIGGVAVEGPVLDAGRQSFVGWHTLPVRHGMTAGELARMFNAERKIGAELDVVPMAGWRRGDFYDRTGLTWVNPSPNLRGLNEALHYPGVGLLETTNVSVGRGTDRPFEWVGAPWLDGQQFAALLATQDLPGVRFVPMKLTPNGSTHKDKPCGGVHILVDDWARFHPVRTGLAMAWALRKLYPQAWQVDRYNVLLGHAATWEGLKRGDPWQDLEKAWQPGLTEFQERRRGYLLYPE